MDVLARAPMKNAIVGLATCCLASAWVSTQGANAAGSSGRVLIPDARPSWVRSAVALHQLNAGRPLTVRVYLTPRNFTALLAAVDAVSNPSDPSYRHFLGPAAYRTRYAPSSESVASTATWLRGAGLIVTRVASGNRYLEAVGSAAVVERAFGAALADYRVDGVEHYAPVAPVSAPAAVAANVLAVTGLSDGTTAARPAAVPPPGAFRNSRPCSSYYGQVVARFRRDATTPLPRFRGRYRPYAVCGYSPSQLRGAYEGRSAWNGAGVTVAVVDAYTSPTLGADAARYARAHGDPPLRRDQFRTVLPRRFNSETACGASDYRVDATVDTEAVHGLALGAREVYYAAASCHDRDFLDALARVVDDDAASIVSGGWVEPESSVSAGVVRAYHALFAQGVLQGQSFFFSSGDNGDNVAATGLRQPNYPASDPLVTAVGGTSLAVGRDAGYRWETGFGVTAYLLSGHSWVAAEPLFRYGAGGGVSSLFARPGYQRHVGNPRLAGRLVPDVAVLDDPTTGVLVGVTQAFPHAGARYGEFRLGGGNIPVMAGLQARAEQAAGGRIGSPNTLLYGLPRSAAFHDITAAHDSAADVRPDFANGVNAADGVVYSVRTLDDDGTLHTAPGWDDVTGLGSPTVHYPAAVAAAVGNAMVRRP